MNWILALVKYGIPILLFWIQNQLEKDPAKKKKKNEALKEVTDGLKENNTSKVTAGFDRINHI